MKMTTLTKTTLPFAVVAFLVSQPLQAATTSFDDFSSDPNLAGDWTDTGWPATMESAVRSGASAAMEAMRSLVRSERQISEA